MQKQVFLSHATDDKELYVVPFAKKLDEAGISYWLDEAEIKWGDKIGQKINDGLNLSSFVVVFLTPSFVGRNWTETELSAAINRENDEGRVLVLPIVIGDPKTILAKYPLLRDKSYLLWDRGLDVIVNKLKKLVYLSRSEKPRENISESLKSLATILPPSGQLLTKASSSDYSSLFSAFEMACARLYKNEFYSTTPGNFFGFGSEDDKQKTYIDIREPATTNKTLIPMSISKSVRNIDLENQIRRVLLYSDITVFVLPISFSQWWTSYSGGEKLREDRNKFLPLIEFYWHKGKKRLGSISQFFNEIS